MARAKKAKSLKDLQAEMEALQRQIEERASQEKVAELTGSAEFKKVARAVARLGADEVASLFSAAPAPAKRKVAPKKKKTGMKVQPKYRHPENGELTWTGRGKQPRWLVEALSQGLTLEQMLIQ